MKKLLILALATLAFLRVMPLGAVAQDIAEVSATVPAPAPSVLEGKWLRPDGGYVLQLSHAGAVGQLTAAYFNPDPIHVEHTEWKLEDGKLGVFVKLQAPNYPGSTYTLTYDAAKDRLTGIYFQALLHQSFNVEFSRQLQ